MNITVSCQFRTRDMLWIAGLVLTATAYGETHSLSKIAENLKVDDSVLSVSGVSSGAYMAQQFHIAHSSRVTGAGIIAGGPYDCAKGRYFWSPFDMTGLYSALHVCSATGLFGIYHGPPDAGFSVTSTLYAARQGSIDEPSHLAKSRVWLFSGANDEKIPSGVPYTLARYYETFMDADHIVFEQHHSAGHAMITDDFGSTCETDAPPYINDCDYDAASTLLQHVHVAERLAPKAHDSDLSEVITFDQTAFFDKNDGSVSLHEAGHVYVPKSCITGMSCQIHVAFHGCMQNQDEIQDAFYRNAGYNEIAETNNIIVLYPQVIAWPGSRHSAKRQNPRGCWDWWGYSDDNYSRRAGKQISAVAQMINTLIGRS
ncbi:MAG: hypothetical protein GY703_07030, partial [Gammaproteobacteria bacterium]|nr:hypothetical protein [Gammaproteobacteria bacterium]